MKFKYLSAVVAVVLVIGYLLPPVVKLKEAALGVVVLIGLALMLRDLWDSLRSKED
jgi:hypothetical protein